MKYLITKFNSNIFVNDISHMVDDGKLKCIKLNSHRDYYFYLEDKSSDIIDIDDSEINKLFKSNIKEISNLAKQKILKLANIEYE